MNISKLMQNISNFFHISNLRLKSSNSGNKTTNKKLTTKSAGKKKARMKQLKLIHLWQWQLAHFANLKSLNLRVWKNSKEKLFTVSIIKLGSHLLGRGF